MEVERRFVPAGYLYVDGVVGDVGRGVLRDRRALAAEGIVVVIVTIDGHTGEIVTGPEIVTKGWVHAPEAEALLEEAKEAVRQSLREAIDQDALDFETLRRHARSGLQKFITSRTKRRPPSSRSSWRSSTQNVSRTIGSSQTAVAAVTVVTWPPERNAVPPPRRPAPLPAPPAPRPPRRSATGTRSAAPSPSGACTAHRREIAGVGLLLTGGLGGLGDLARRRRHGRRLPRLPGRRGGRAWAPP